MINRENASAAAVFGIIALVFFVCIIVAAYPIVLGSTAEDAISNNITNSTHALTYESGTTVSEGFMGLSEAMVFFIVIVGIVAALILIFGI